MILLIGLVLLVSAVQAKSPAPVIKTVDCALLASDGTPFMGTGQLVIKHNEVTLTCKGIQPAEIPYPEKEVRFDYASTVIDYEIYEVGMSTQNWKEVINRSGKVTLKAKIDLNPEPKEENEQSDDDDE